MARSRPDKRAKKQKNAASASSASEFSPAVFSSLLEHASESLQTGQPDEALDIAQKAYQYVSVPNTEPLLQLPALKLLGEIHVELGNPDEARQFFLEAAKLDPEGSLPEAAGGGSDKFLWLAQLSEEGGAESIQWFEKGIVALRRDIAELQDKATPVSGTGGAEDMDMRRQKLASALCGAAEVYMTDLSWEEDAEARCETLVTEACVVAPESPEPLQTLASVRISQSKPDDARSALSRSLELWIDLPEQDPRIPDFPTQISLSRLLMEAEMEEKAMDVLERLVTEDDSSVEAWYLGGWCLHLLAEKQTKKLANGANGATESTTKTRTGTLKSSRDWLQNSLKLFNLVDYEDDRLKEHAEELVALIDREIGPKAEDDADDDEDDDDWEDEDDGEGEDADTADDEDMG